MKVVSASTTWGMVVVVVILSMGYSHGISFTFDSFNSGTTNLTFQGDAHVPSESTFLRLTATDSKGRPNTPNSVGRVLYSYPLLLSKSSTKADFQTTIKFTITPYLRGVADGIVFFLAPVDSQPNAAGGNHGIYDSSGVAASVFAVQFDTYENEWESGTGEIQINFYSRIPYNYTKFNSATGEEVTATITYEAATGTITAVASSCRQPAATVTYVRDLTGILPEKVQVGLSASNGPTLGKDGVHDIHYWSFTSTIDGVNDNPLSSIV